MQNFEDYTPEMLVYYNSLSEPLKRRLAESKFAVEDLQSLAAAAEMLAQAGVDRMPEEKEEEGAAVRLRPLLHPMIVPDIMRNKEDAIWKKEFFRILHRRLGTLL